MVVKLAGRMLIACALAALGLVFVSATPAQAKQCIWNKGGFVLRVDWFTPDGVKWADNPSDGFLEFTFLEQPVQTDVFWAGNGRCINRGTIQYHAVLSMCGGSYPSRIIAYPPEWPETNRIDCALNAVVVPSFDRWWDVWGPIWEPKSGQGGPI